MARTELLPRLVPHPSVEQARARRWLILAVLCLSLVVIVMGNVSLNIALPRITDELGASFTQLQWMVDAYSLLFAALLLFAGALGDRYGRKGALQGGLLVFGVASLAASFATSSEQVIAARAVMGIAAAFVMPGTLSILATVFEPAERHRAIAIWAGVAGASVAVGMLWSGLLLEHFSWSSVFLTNVPIVAVALVLGAFLLPASRDPTGTPLDRVGALLSVLMLGALLFALIEGPVRGWTDPTIVGGFVAAAALFAGFVWWEHHVEEPMLDFSFFREPRFSVGCLTIVVSFLCLFGIYFLLTQYLQEVRGLSPLEAGVATLPAGVMQLIVAPLSARMVERWTYRPVLAGGMLLTAVGSLLFAFLGPSTSLGLLMVSLALLGAGLGIATPPATGAILAALPLRKAGVGSAVNDTTRELGGAIGIALLGSLVTSRFRAGLADTTRSLPSAVRDAAAHGIGPALGVARTRPVMQVAPHLADTARSAFTSGLLLAGLVGTVLAVAGAVAVYRLMPRGLRPHRGDEGSATA